MVADLWQRKDKIGEFQHFSGDLIVWVSYDWFLMKMRVLIDGDILFTLKVNV